MRFHRFRLDSRLLEALATAGYLQPTPIQDQAIPVVLAGRDVVGIAQTGTGKTAAFGLPILHRLLGSDSDRGRFGHSPGDNAEGPSSPPFAQRHGTRTGHVHRSRGSRAPRALVLAPTRELAEQIRQSLDALGRYTKVRTIAIYGGVSKVPQTQALRRGVDIVVACPGRLLDLHADGAIDLSSVSIAVLDEADHMLDMGFLPDVRRILGFLPQKRQTLLFSATMPEEIRGLAARALRDPMEIRIGRVQPASTVSQGLYEVGSASEKTSLLISLLEELRGAKVLVFTRTKHRASGLAKKLQRAGHRVSALQGNMAQNQRDRAISGFKGGTIDVLVATDIAARGIDVAEIAQVINFDITDTVEAYTHRIGRTGRAERTGRAVTFVVPDDRDLLREIERRTGSRLERLSLPDVFEAQAASLMAVSAGRRVGEAATAAPGRDGHRSNVPSPRSGAPRSGSPRSGNRSATERRDARRRSGGDGASRDGRRSGIERSKKGGAGSGSSRPALSGGTTGGNGVVRSRRNGSGASTRPGSRRGKGEQRPRGEDDRSRAPVVDLLARENDQQPSSSEWGRRPRRRS